MSPEIVSFVEGLCARVRPCRHINFASLEEDPDGRAISSESLSIDEPDKGKLGGQSSGQELLDLLETAGSGVATRRWLMRGLLTALRPELLKDI